MQDNYILKQIEDQMPSDTPLSHASPQELLIQNPNLNMKDHKVALFIPTYNAMGENAKNFVKTLKVISNANLNEVLIIDSSSIDNTVDIVKTFGFRILTIPKNTFNHSGTRNEAFNLLKAKNNFIIFLTQDIVIPNIDSLNKLIQPMLHDDLIAGSYGRQIAHTNADIFAKHLRAFNYPDKSYIRSYTDRFVYGIKCAFSSDSFAAYNVNALTKINGFPERLILGEDMYVFAKFLQEKYKVAYIAEAICYHSHNYSIKDEFKRYFDIGVFHRTETWILRDFGAPDKHGIKYIMSEFKFLGYNFHLWPKLIAKTIAKYVGYKLGYHFDIIGVILCRKFSFNPSFWW